jgi:hypothetical protein
VDLGHFDLGHFDLGHIDLGHFDIGHFDLHFDTPFDDVPFDDVPIDGGGDDGESALKASPTVARVSQAFDRLGQALAHRDADALARHQQVAQSVDLTLQRASASFGHLATATSKTIMDLQQQIKNLEARIAQLEKKGN